MLIDWPMKQLHLQVHLNSIPTNDFQKERKNFVVTIILLLGPGNPEHTQQIQLDSGENGKTVKWIETANCWGIHKFLKQSVYWRLRSQQLVLFSVYFFWQRQNLQAHLLHKLKGKEMQKWEDPYFHNLEAAHEGVECVKLMQDSFWQQSLSVYWKIAVCPHG